MKLSQIAKPVNARKKMHVAKLSIEGRRVPKIAEARRQQTCSDV
jgi:hypothetical protein